MIGNFELFDIIVLVTLWFITSMVANLIWTRFVVLRYVGRAFLAWLDNVDEDPEAQRVLEKLFLMMFTWVGSAQIKTGKKVKIKDEETGEESEKDEILSPVDMLARVITSMFWNKYRASLGSVKVQLDKVIRDEVGALGGDGVLSPSAMIGLSKGKFGPALGELAMQYMPKRKSPNNDTSSGGEGRY